MSVIKSEYEIEKGDFGPRLVLQGDWSLKYRDYMLAYGIKEINVNYAWGYTGTSLEFLKQLPFLEGLLLLVYHIPNTSTVQSLPNLRSFINGCRDKTPLDFDQFPRLEKCGINWRKGSESLFRCNSLKWLNISNLADKTTEDFVQLTNLSTLELTYSPQVRDLAGLSSLTSLRTLGLYWQRHLATLANISTLTELQVLNIQTCTKLTSLEDVKSLVGLEFLNIVNCGDIASLKPIASLPDLKQIGFVGTNILDGDLSVLASSVSLKNYIFNNRRHYSHRREKLLQMRSV